MKINRKDKDGSILTATGEAGEWIAKAAHNHSISELTIQKKDDGSLVYIASYPCERGKRIRRMNAAQLVGALKTAYDVEPILRELHAYRLAHPPMSEEEIRRQHEAREAEIEEGIREDRHRRAVAREAARKRDEAAKAVAKPAETSAETFERRTDAGAFAAILVSEIASEFEEEDGIREAASHGEEDEHKCLSF